MDVRTIRKRKHITLKRVSEYLDLPIPVYIYYEIMGINLMHTDLLIDLCDLLGIDYHML
ncbi:XRE family transcriptional regulator [Eubacterium sp. AM47-9]|nr:XRE family transcriptional regulator [Eubacterium sp. AM47-9]